LIELEPDYTAIEAVEAMNMGQSTMDKWVRWLKTEHNGIQSEFNNTGANCHSCIEKEISLY